MKIGAHVSTAGGIANAPERAAAIGAEAIQIFTSIPQTWKKRTITDADVAAFRQGMTDRGIGPTFIHGIYLMNFGTSNPEQLVKSEEALVTDMTHGSRIGAGGVIFHLGVFHGDSFEAVAPQIVEALTRVLEATPSDIRLVIENAAGERKGAGSTFAQIGTLVRDIGSERVRVCLDTQHAFASGYDLTTRDELHRMMDEFDREVGLDRLVAVHANDSKVTVRLRGRPSREHRPRQDWPRGVRAHPRAPGLPRRALPARGAWHRWRWARRGEHRSAEGNRDRRGRGLSGRRCRAFQRPR